MSTIQTFCAPSSCTNTNGMRIGTHNPATLRKIINAITSNNPLSQRNAFATEKFIDDRTFDISIPPNIITDTSNLPVVNQSLITELGDCMDVMNAFTCAESNTYEQFLCLMHFISDAKNSMLDFSGGDPSLLTCAGLQFYMIFDGKIPVFYGTLISSGGQLILDPMEIVKFLFPPTFMTFSFGLYDINTNTYYVSQSV
jgi:hypothetical protein